MPALQEVIARTAQARRLAIAYVSSLYEGAKANGTLRDIERCCMFVGYPRSGHTLIGSLLNAHPSFVISHELDALRYVSAGFGRKQLFSLILRADREFVAGGNLCAGYDYSVPGQWQGKFERLAVIGDKKAAASALQVRKRPELLARLRRTVGVDVLLIHVVRNPYDNIATMFRRGFTRGDREDLQGTIRSYFKLCEGVDTALAQSRPEHARTVRHEDFVADPRAVLAELCRFLGREPGEEYLAACTSIVFKSPKQRRHQVEWSPAAREAVDAGIRRFDFLAGYSFDS